MVLQDFNFTPHCPTGLWKHCSNEGNVAKPIFTIITSTWWYHTPFIHILSQSNLIFCLLVHSDHEEFQFHRSKYLIFIQWAPHKSCPSLCQAVWVSTLWTVQIGIHLIYEAATVMWRGNVTLICKDNCCQGILKSTRACKASKNNDNFARWWYKKCPIKKYAGLKPES